MSHVVIVTGASSGFGEMAALGLARAGHTVYAGYRSRAARADKAAAHERIASDESIALIPIDLDITDQASVDGAVARIITAEGRIDAIVHNAGHMSYGPAEAFSPEQLLQLYAVNTIGTQRLNRAALPHLRAARSGLLLWVSSSSVRGNWSPWLAGYFAAKAGMEQLAMSYALELAPFGIETSIVVPGVFTTGTDHFANAMEPADAGVVKAYETGPAAGLGQAVLDATECSEPDGADPGEVGRRIVEIVGMAAGTRPFRVTIDPAQDGSEIVAAVQDRFRRDTLQRLGLGHLLIPAIGQGDAR